MQLQAEPSRSRIRRGRGGNVSTQRPESNLLAKCSVWGLRERGRLRGGTLSERKKHTRWKVFWFHTAKRVGGRTRNSSVKNDSLVRSVRDREGPQDLLKNQSERGGTKVNTGRGSFSGGTCRSGHRGLARTWGGRRNAGAERGVLLGGLFDPILQCP